MTPEGSLSYSINGYNADGTPQVTQTQRYSDVEQQKYDQQNQVALALNGAAVNNIDRVNQAQATPFNYDDMTPLKTSAGADNPFQLQSGPTGAPPLRNELQQRDLQYGAGVGGTQGGVKAGNLMNSIGSGNVQDTVNPGDVRSSAGVGDAQYNVNRGDVRNSIGVGSTRDTLNAGALQYGAQGAGSAQGVDPRQAGQGVQGGLDYSNLTQLPGTQDFSADANRVANSVYSQAASRLDPRFQQSESDMRSRLAAQGITENSEAYRRELDNASRDRNDAYNQAAYSAQQAGGAEQSRLFGLSMSARQQGQNEANTQGQFTNSAQQQSYAQMLAAQNANQSVQAQNYGQNSNEAQFYNSAQGQNFTQQAQQADLYNNAQNQAFNQRSADTQLYNSAQGQIFGQDQQNAQLYNQAQAQQYGQRANEANLYNTAQGQIFGQGVQSADLYNQAQQQQYDQRANNADFYNQAQAQQFGQGQQNAQLYNQSQQQAYTQRANEANLYNSAQGQAFGQEAQSNDLFNQTQQQTFANQQAAAASNNLAQNQYYNQSAANATFNNNARQQQIQESTYLRNLPLNDIAALLNGNQAQAPAFQNYAQVGVAAPDYQGLVQSNYNSAMSQYNQQQASRSQMLGSIAGLAGTAMKLSDMRFKENIIRIGTLASGLGTYAFNYIGDRAQQFGVMAQEVLQVIPDAVQDVDGVMYVDYGKVY